MIRTAVGVFCAFAACAAAQEPGDFEVLFTWTTSAQAEQYTLYQGGVRVTDIPGGATDSYTADGAGLGIVYGEESCFSLTARNEAGESPPSNSACLTVDEPVTTPAAPTDFDLRVTTPADDHDQSSGIFGD